MPLRRPPSPGGPIARRVKRLDGCGYGSVAARPLRETGPSLTTRNSHDSGRVIDASRNYRTRINKYKSAGERTRNDHKRLIRTLVKHDAGTQYYYYYYTDKPVRGTRTTVGGAVRRRKMSVRNRMIAMGNVKK